MTENAKKSSGMLIVLFSIIAGLNRTLRRAEINIPDAKVVIAAN